jgi:hypothetical protein
MSKKEKQTEYEVHSQGAPLLECGSSSPAVEELVNAVTVRESTLPAEALDISSWGSGPALSSQDIIMPRIMLMQGMSKKVTAGEAAFGELRESLNNGLLGKFNECVEFIPFYMEKVWVEFDVTKGVNIGQKQFLRVVPITPINESLPYEDTGKDRDGKDAKIMRDRCMVFYVLFPEEIRIGGAIPYILTARRSSLNAGKKLATQMFVKNQMAGKTPASVICQVISKKESNDKGTFAVLDIIPSKPTPSEYIVEAFRWLQLIKAGKAKVDETSYVEDFTESTSVQEAPTGEMKF